MTTSLPPLRWTHAPGSAGWSDDGTSLTLVSAAGVDWTNDAGGGEQQHGSTSLGFVVEGDVTLSARVRVEPPRTTFDAGALTIWADRDHWAKLCFECSPQGEEMVVSVVTDHWSDDVNSAVITGGEVYLRVARTGPAWAFHYSTDGRWWHFVRLFRLAGTETPLVGFLAQAPFGDACTAHFAEIGYAPTGVAELRDGS